MRPSFYADPWFRLSALALAGAVFGLATSMVNHGFGPGAAYVSKVLGSGSVWLLAGFASALTGIGWRGAIKRSCMFLLPAVVSYYIADALAGVYTSPNLDDPTDPVSFDLYGMATDIGFYVLAALAASAILGLVVSLIQRKGIIGVLASIAVPGCIALSALTHHHRLLAMDFPVDPAEVAATWWVGIAALILTAAAIPVRLISGSEPWLLIRGDRQDDEKTDSMSNSSSPSSATDCQRQTE